jgi:hypothetical protein
MREHPEWWAAIKTIFNLYNLPRIIGQNLKFPICQGVSSFRIFPGCPKCLGINKNSSTL